ncbi:uncharacterized protein GLRG_03965 [Colletotrichum graminicola M1.001]|uniref:Uncharacterized protein n=1 Tax=Colletotrichum graminicola (strain M1.001 / M2 / FGSC 10212) TaxID=645133 RepID=E3QD49_COLGM|nr:uncharacterized protein GLRG_03965 [Colletotrichum graminicola M1.001]EFQ28821.1 hypothetical protein GLRG_03965 [Colletotrichum graminicola M1.001]
MPANFIAGFSELNIATIEVLLREAESSFFNCLNKPSSNFVRHQKHSNPKAYYDTRYNNNHIPAGDNQPNKTCRVGPFSCVSISCPRQLM